MYTQSTINDINYTITGTGTPMIFCHAGFVDSGMWQAQIDHFAKDYQVICYDMQGFGQSSPATAPISRRHELKNLMDELEISEAILVGCSLSGATILDFALDYPEQVKALVVVSAIPNGFDLQGEPPRYMFEMFGALQSGDLETASELQMRIWFDGMFREPTDVDVNLRKAVKAMNQIALDKHGITIGNSPAPNPLEPPAINRLADITQPTLLIAGKLDHPEVLRAQTVMQEAMPDATTHIISATAHLPNMEQSSEFNQVVTDFLNRI